MVKKRHKKNGKVQESPTLEVPEEVKSEPEEIKLPEIPQLNTMSYLPMGEQRSFENQGQSAPFGYNYHYIFHPYPYVLSHER